MNPANPAPWLRLAAGDPEAQSQFDFHLRQRPADSRSRDAACADGGLSQHHSADGISRGAAFSGDAVRRGGRQRASVEDRGALPPTDGDARFHSRFGAGGADEGAPGAAVHDRDRAQPTASLSLTPESRTHAAQSTRGMAAALRAECAALRAARARSPRRSARAFNSKAASRSKPMRRLSAGSLPERRFPPTARPALPNESEALPTTSPRAGASLKPLGQIRDSFILAVNPRDSGLSTSMSRMSACCLRRS